ncbi:4Fe-4S dicluster domain-containing protein [Anaerobacillus sp. CMMVII]|uniref:4Fe-4S dicluster domain-containing protein n=1 Tax=Anaerobacillus sp. CMMVII TaxID=2755588 RepID=UPI0021B711E0|nr:4Fe-4S dicluster domain-containing protein [Anaerobacillus sp. CMMVII]MCT8137543.1 4Fe-4S dicluster domain-containing protein [Anaerobacillus sp. CMMVII]
MSSAIRNLLSTDVVEVYEEACKNFRNKTVACRLCIDCCSEEAISLQNQIPTIIAKKCIDCCACVSECPVNAIDHIRKPYGKISEYVNDFPFTDITCDQVEEVNRGIKVPCLLFLDAPLLSQYADKREELHIYTGHCQTCKKSNEERIIIHFKNLERELERLGISILIKAKYQMPEDSIEQIVDAVSRRDLLKKFSLANIKELLLNRETISEKDEQTLSIIERMHLKKKILDQSRNRAGSRINKTSSKISSFLFSIKVNEECNGCNVCERICPTNALFWKDEPGISYLMFEPNSCIHCSKCLACPQKALAISERTHYDDEIPSQLIAMEIKICRECGETFKTIKDHEQLCFFCEAKSSKDPMRFFTTE